MSIVRLKHPVQANGETVTQLTFSRPQVKHLRSMDGVSGEVAKTAHLIGELAGLPPSAVDDMDAEDFAACAEVIGGFLGKAPPTGGTSAAT